MCTSQHTTNSIDLPASDRDAMCAVFSHVPEVEEVFVFGSRAMGNAKRGSDVDIALKGQGVTRDTVARVRADLADLPLVPYFFDVVDYHSITDEALRTHIDTHGVCVYRIHTAPACA